MDLRSGCPFWQVRGGLIGAYPALDADLECEVAVIGGGVTGALIAHALVGAGVNTVLADKRDFGWGSTSASTALLQYDLDVPLEELAGRIGEARAVACYRSANEAVAHLVRLAESLPDHCGIARRPAIYLASSARHRRGLEREHAIRVRNGFAVELWDRHAVSAHFSFRRAAALYHTEAAEVDPYRLTYALIAEAAGHGLRAFDRTEITSAELDRRSALPVRLTTARGFRIKARTVVFATGYETQRRLRQRSVMLRSTYAVASEPVDRFDGWHGRCLIWESARPYHYLRTTDDGRVIIGGEDDGFVSADRRDRALPGKARRLVREAERMFPDIPFEAGFCWAGTFADTEDGLPYIGRHPRHPNAWFAAAYGGNGTPFGVIAADIVRDGILGEPNRTSALFAFDRAPD